ncbi:MAG: bifunctional DedA family/phosphatase PAP2 family protein [Solirubrobacteraceae bacterium]|nr:bifunctional DedA family/phosphatase PAP2 family protein [Solirubrobacteraceae bacterium]
MKPLWLAAAAAGTAFGIAVRRRLTRTQALLLAAVVLVALAYGLGLFELPNIKKLIADLGQALGPYTYILVAAGAFLETGAFVGLIAPGETIMIVGGVIAGQGEIRLGPLILIVWVSAVAGDTVSFMLGKRLGRDFLLRHGPRVQITEERLLHVEKFLERRGGTTILIGRFVGVVRAVAPFVLGASHMPYRRFLPYDILGAGLWAATFTILGYVFWQSFDRVATYASQGAFALGTVIVVTIGIVLLYRQLRDEQGRAEARGFLHEQAERPLLKPFAPAVRFAVFRIVVPVAKRLRGPVWFAIQRVTPGGLGLEFTTVMAILAVGAFVFIEYLVVVTKQALAFGDQWAADAALRLRTAAGVDAAEIVTWFGSFGVVGVATLVAAGVLIARRHVPEAAVVVIGLALSQAAVHATKAAVDRPRPAGGLVDAAGSSFPSAHAAHAIVWIVLAVALARAVPWLAGRVAVIVGAIVFAAIVGLTRVYLGVHYLSDVSAGWAQAAAIFAACAAVALVVTHIRQNQQPDGS